MDSFSHDDVWRDAINGKGTKMYTGYENFTTPEICRFLREDPSPLIRELVVRVDSLNTEITEANIKIDELDEEIGNIKEK